MRYPVLLTFSVLILAAGFLGAEEPPSPVQLPTDHQERMARGLDLFKREVGGILRGRCLKCHGGETTEGEFDLSTREQLLRGAATGPAIVLGEAKKSLLMKMVAGQVEPQMPDDGAPLSAAAQTALARWIDLGAPYDRPLVEKSSDPLAWTKRTIEPAQREFWSFQPLASVSPPQLENDDWSRSEIDRFLLQALREQQLRPNPQADRRTLIRRAYFDLIGLPPTPEEIEAFVADDRPDAYGKLLDHLLDRPQYGERWARYWLDVARFAESHGFEQDYDREYAFHFRDFVIQALNQDMPYRQFVRWQIAGDELAPDEPLAMMATGFLGAGVFPTQITKNEVERTRYDALDDMAATTGVAFLGLTVGCARCHDHKFDPIPQADYYRFVSTFTTAVRSNQKIDLDPAATRREMEEFQKQHAPLVAALRTFEKQELPTRFAAWEEKNDLGSLPQDWVISEPVEYQSAGGATLTLQDDGSLLATGKNPDFDTYTVTLETTLDKLAGLRVEALADPSLAKGGPGRAANGNIALTNLKVAAQPLQGEEKPILLQLTNPQATFEQPRLEVKNAIDDNAKSAWAVDPQFGKDHAAIFTIANPPSFQGGARLTVTLEFKNNKQHNIGRLRLSVTPTLPEPYIPVTGGLREQVLAAFAAPPLTRSAEQQAELLAWYRTRDPQWQALHAAVEKHQAAAPQGFGQMVMIVSEGVKPIRHHTQGADFFEETYFLNRGDTDQKATVAEQGFLQVLMPSGRSVEDWKTPAPDGSAVSYRRTALADWLTDTQEGAGQLLARVIVNRVWQHHFGAGIVATPNDFGYQGSRPSHPALLDYLAQDLISNGWRLKRLHKQIMMTAAYRQSSEFHEEAARRDPQNKWLWRYAPKRLEAESIRDSMLAVSGQLDPTMYGAGVLDENHLRRSIYFKIKRSKLIPSMQLFDSPEPLVSVGQRPSTTIAPQALHFMNNALVRRSAGGLADRVLKQHQDREQQIDQAYRLALGRKPDADERAAAIAFVESQAASHQQAQQPDAEKIALTDFCQVLLSLNEFIYVD